MSREEAVAGSSRQRGEQEESREPLDVSLRLSVRLAMTKTKSFSSKLESIFQPFLEDFAAELNDNNNIADREAIGRELSCEVDDEVSKHIAWLIKWNEDVKSQIRNSYPSWFDSESHLLVQEPVCENATVVDAQVESAQPEESARRPANDGDDEEEEEQKLSYQVEADTSEDREDEVIYLASSDEEEIEFLETKSQDVEIIEETFGTSDVEIVGSLRRKKKESTSCPPLKFRKIDTNRAGTSHHEGSKSVDTKDDGEEIMDVDPMDSHRAESARDPPSAVTSREGTQATGTSDVAEQGRTSDNDQVYGEVNAQMECGSSLSAEKAEPNSKALNLSAKGPTSSSLTQFYRHHTTTGVVAVEESVSTQPQVKVDDWKSFPLVAYTANNYDGIERATTPVSMEQHPGNLPHTHSSLGNNYCEPEDEQSTEGHNETNPDDGAGQSDGVSMDPRNDPKLYSSRVVVTRLPEWLREMASKGTVVISEEIPNPPVNREENELAALEREIKRLEKINRGEITFLKDTQAQPSKRQRGSRRPRKRGVQREDEECGRYSDSDESESNYRNEPVNLSSPARAPAEESSSDKGSGEESESDYRNCGSDSESGSEARRKVLKGCRETREWRTKNAAERKKYIQTPCIRGLLSKFSSESDGDDNDEEKVTRKYKRIIRVARSDSNDSDSWEEYDKLAADHLQSLKSERDSGEDMDNASLPSYRSASRSQSPSEPLPQQRGNGSSDSDSSGCDFRNPPPRSQKMRKRKRKPISTSEESTSEDTEQRNCSPSRSPQTVKACKATVLGNTNSSTTPGSEKNAQPPILANNSSSKVLQLRNVPEPSSTESSCNSESEEDEEPKRGRKNIRPIMSVTEWRQETKQANVKEIIRRKRIEERTAQIGEILALPFGDTLEKLVLDADPVTKEPVVSVDPELVRNLKPHQGDGIRFMWTACFESLQEFQRLNSSGGGCILAHCMGLGKTLQTIALLHTVMTTEGINLKTALVLCPKNTAYNWSCEIEKWTRDLKVPLKVHELYAKTDPKSRTQLLQKWQENGGICVAHYESFRNLVQGKRAGGVDDFESIVQKSLLDPGPDIVVCDEGHVLKNDKSGISTAVSRIRTARRIVLTGTPLQNNLLEYHCMVQFVKPDLLGSKKEFCNQFVNPITNGQQKNSSDADVRVMQKMSHVLHKILEGCVHRRDFSELKPYLPTKYEYVILIRISETQENLYLHYLRAIKSTNARRVLRRSFLPHLKTLERILCHPRALALKRKRVRKPTQNKLATPSEENVLNDLISLIENGTNDKNTNTTANAEGSNMQTEETEDNIATQNVREEEGSPPSASNVNPLGGLMEDTDEEVELDIEGDAEWWLKLVQGDLQAMELSHKLVILFEILRRCEEVGDKVLVFSQHTYSLDVIEGFLKTMERSSAENSSTSASKKTRWRKNIEYFRIDGQTTVDSRQKQCHKFNAKTDTSRAKLFLISTKAGGLGINLVGANRVVIFDPCFNPSHDLQSIFRVYRFGQTKDCYVYRLISAGTAEEKIHRRQITKLSLSCRVVDEHQIKRHYTFEDISKMFDYDLDVTAPPEVPDLPQDQLLRDLYTVHSNIIHDVVNHDALLEDQVDQRLSDREREIAWLEYVAEKDMKKKDLEAAVEAAASDNDGKNHADRSDEETQDAGSDKGKSDEERRHEDTKDADSDNSENDEDRSDEDTKDADSDSDGSS